MCTRCAKRNHCCRYGLSSQAQPFRLQVPEIEPIFTFPSPTSTPSPTSLPSSSPLPLLPIHAEASVQLNFQELSLFSHYISRTSKVIAFDKDDLYALSVGIPNLAFTSKPVMDSLLALSAASKSYDMLSMIDTPLSDLSQIDGLLTLADQRHTASLEQVQAALPTLDQYNDVFANAALMVLYSSASHCVRIKVTELAKAKGVNLPGHLYPYHSQWISLIRAAHMAYAGLQHQPDQDLSLADLPLEDDVEVLDENALSPEDGPTEQTKTLLLPIISATSDAAFSSLFERAQETAASVQDETQLDELRVCTDTLSILKQTAAEVFTPSKKSDRLAASETWTPLGKLSRVSSWLRRYLGRVTSSTPTTPLRRTIMSFVNQVPIEYLSLVQSILDIIPIDSAESLDVVTTPTQRLAMDIFAHWLVLVMLLDGVWWIGPIGGWELGRVVAFMRSQQLHDERNWWPESMLLIKNEIIHG